MNVEDNLMKKIGKENPFKVPDGYFEQFASSMMDKLPEKEKTSEKEEQVTTWTKLKPLLYMAAMFVGAALIIRVASSDHRSLKDNSAVSSVTDTETVSDEIIDAAIDGSMMDDYSLYVYLSEFSGE